MLFVPLIGGTRLQIDPDYVMDLEDTFEILVSDDGICGSGDLVVRGAEGDPNPDALDMEMSYLEFRCWSYPSALRPPS